MLSNDDLKSRVDLHDLAEKLNLVRPAAGGNYRSPHHDDKSPSLSIFKEGRAFIDHSAGGVPHSKGDCISLVMYVTGCDYHAAIKELHELYGWDYQPKPKARSYRRVDTEIEFIAKKGLANNPQPAIEYLQSRALPDEVIQLAFSKKVLAYSDYVNPRYEPGDARYGGPAVQAIVRDLVSNQIIGIDSRYFDPEINGGVKTKSFGEKQGAPWTLCRESLKKASVVYVVEGWLDALCVEACGLPNTAAIATRGTRTVESIAWNQFRGKKVCLAFDADHPDKFGNRAGDVATWAAFDACAAADVTARVVDRIRWYDEGWKDLNDILAAKGVKELSDRLIQMEPWAIAGLPGRGDSVGGKRRIFLPPHDFSVYWRFRVKSDFTTYLVKVEEGEDGEPKTIASEDVAGFRVASVNRVSIASPTSVFSGKPDLQPTVQFSVSVQMPRHGQVLKRQVLPDDRLYSIAAWEKFGPVFNVKRLSRLINMLERTANLAPRSSLNIVGIGHQNGKPVVSEGADCYLTNPKQQCPYNEMVFARGTVSDAQKLVTAYGETFKENAALQSLVWVLGGHLKCFLGFWPHLTLEAPKAAGKTTLLKAMESHLGMTVFAGHSIQSPFRVLTSLSNTTHAVAWEELSARDQKLIDMAVSSLQEAYSFNITRRNSDLLEHILCAPVLLSGEDVPVSSLLGKLVRVDLTGRKASPLPDSLPPFPMRQWLEFLAKNNRENLRERHRKCIARALAGSNYIVGRDDAAGRIVSNYGAILLAWELLMEFTRMAEHLFDFEAVWISELDRHLADTRAEREPWVHLMEVGLHEIDAGRYPFPNAVDDYKGNNCLWIRHGEILHHIKASPGLRRIFEASPIKSPKAFKKALLNSGVVVSESGDKIINEKRYGRMLVLSIDRLESFDLSVTDPSVYEASPESLESRNT